jgi:hypothetical protein
MRNNNLAIDLIRKDRFKSSEKIKNVEELIITKNVVINWWCRNSGKTLTSIKIARDTALSKPSKILFISMNSKRAKDISDLIYRSIDRTHTLPEQNLKNTLLLTNGSIIVSASINSYDISEDVDMIIVDEFDLIKENLVQSIIDKYEEIERKITNKKVSFWKKFISLFSSKKEEEKHVKLLMSSSKGEGVSFVKLLDWSMSRKDAAITRLNWEKTTIDKEKLITILGEETFEKDYNSYG